MSKDVILDGEALVPTVIVNTTEIHALASLADAKRLVQDTKAARVTLELLTLAGLTNLREMLFHNAT